MAQKINDVTLFSNGIGHFRRIYNIEAGSEKLISLPFKSDCIGDVAASLQVFGKVRLNSPPSFTPANSNATSLRIDQSESLKSLLRQLSGSLISVTMLGSNTPYANCKLLGLDSEALTNFKGNEIAKDFIVVMLPTGSIRRLELAILTGINFEEESVRTEIEKALKANFQQIKPDSTMLDLSLSSVDEGETQVVVQYTIPVAAWKMRYSIREEKGKFMIEGAAIIDNNTDEDWNDFQVSVVTGNPISFNTDIANVVVPRRKMVHLVDQNVQGNVEAEEGVMCLGGAAPEPRPKGVRAMAARSLGPKMSTANYASFGTEGFPEDDEYSIQQLACGSANLAVAPGVESKDVGDFCVFTSKEPITLLARKSAVVPMFLKALDHAGVVLLYKESNNARRPYRTIKFKNETDVTLGRGKTVIYNEGLFSGECVLETAKPGENRMLPHCLENGVKIVKENKGQQVRRSSINIAKGVGITEDIHSAATAYTIENKKDEPFKVALEHINEIHGPNTEVKFEGLDIKEREKLLDSEGHRVYFELKPKENRELRVLETRVTESKCILTNNHHWLMQTLVDAKSPLLDDTQIKACIQIQEQLGKVQEEATEATDRREELTEQAQRVRDNLSAAQSAKSKLYEDWLTDLNDTEQEIRTIDKTTLPTLTKRQKELQVKLTDHLKKITATWAADSQ